MSCSASKLLVAGGLEWEWTGQQVLFDDSGVAWGIKATMDGVPQVSYVLDSTPVANATIKKTSFQSHNSLPRRRMKSLTAFCRGFRANMTRMHLRAQLVVQEYFAVQSKLKFAMLIYLCHTTEPCTIVTEISCGMCCFSILYFCLLFFVQVAKATMLIGDPSYFPSRMVKPTGMVARSICIMDHPFNGTNNAESTQIIIPGRQASQSHSLTQTHTHSQVRLTSQSQE